MQNLTVLVSVALVMPLFAASVKIESLWDLKSLEVGIEALPPKGSDLGITEEKLQTDVELRIRKANVLVTRRSEGDAGIVVSVNLMQIGNGPNWAYCITVKLLRAVYLPSPSGLKRSGAITWDAGEMGIGGSAVIERGVRGSVGDLVDKFLNDYLAAHAPAIGAP
jgi:hypothetical protein